MFPKHEDTHKFSYSSVLILVSENNCQTEPKRRTQNDNSGCNLCTALNVYAIFTRTHATVFDYHSLYMLEYICVRMPTWLHTSSRLGNSFFLCALFCSFFPLVIFMVGDWRFLFDFVIAIKELSCGGIAINDYILNIALIAPIHSNWNWIDF